MFRPIRRQKRALSQEETKDILRLARRGVLAMNGMEGYPYAVPINYLYDEENGKIYFHGARAGHKAEALKACGRVCFTVTGSEIIRDEAWAPYMRSAVVFGRCRLMERGAETTAVLKRLAMKYYPNEKLVDEEIEADGKAVQMFEITIEHISGKEVQER